MDTDNIDRKTELAELELAALEAAELATRVRALESRIRRTFGRLAAEPARRAANELALTRDMLHSI